MAHNTIPQNFCIRHLFLFTDLKKSRLKMGNWQLEVAKMAIYMAFPVTSFYVYHQVSRHSLHNLAKENCHVSQQFSGSIWTGCP
jgi:hypothetical protein